MAGQNESIVRRRNCSTYNWPIFKTYKKSAIFLLFPVSKSFTSPPPQRNTPLRDIIVIKKKRFRLIERVNLLENSLDEVHKKCDIVISRLDAIRVHLPPNYAEQSTAQRDNS